MCFVPQDVPPTFHRPQSRLGYEERPQSRVGYTSDSRCASGLGYEDTGGGFLEQSDPRMYCTSGYCMGDTMMATSRGLCGEEVELDMRRHIQACACTCNHMGYGNYMDYQVNCLSNWFSLFHPWQGSACPSPAPPQRSPPSIITLTLSPWNQACIQIFPCSRAVTLADGKSAGIGIISGKMMVSRS